MKGKTDMMKELYMRNVTALATSVKFAEAMQRQANKENQDLPTALYYFTKGAVDNFYTLHDNEE